MVKRARLVIVAALCAATIWGDIDLPERCAGFELDTDADGLPDGWAVLKADEACEFGLSEEAHSGAASFSMRGTGADYHGGPNRSMGALIPHTTYLLEGWFKFNPGQRGKLGALYWDFDVVDAPSGSNTVTHIIDRVPDWTLISGSFNTGDRRIPYARLYPFLLWGEGQAWVDDVKVGAIKGNVLSIPRTEQGPLLDAKLDDDCWASAATIEQLVRNIDPPRFATYPTAIRLAYDDEALYVAYVCTVDDPSKVTGVEPGVAETLWGNDGAEIFIDTNLDQKTYFHFGANAKGAITQERNEGNLPVPWDGKWHSSQLWTLSRRHRARPGG